MIAIYVLYNYCDALLIHDVLVGGLHTDSTIRCEAEIEKLRQKKSRMEVPDELPPSQAKDKDEKEVEDEKREGQEDASEEMTEKEDDEMDTTSDDQQEHGDGDSSNGAPSSRASPISDLLLLTEEEMATTSMRDIDRKISKLQTLKEVSADWPLPLHQRGQNLDGKNLTVALHCRA